MDWIKVGGAGALFGFAALALLMLAGKLDRPLLWLLALVSRPLRHVREARPDPGDAHDVEPTPDEPENSGRPLNPATRERKLTREQRALDLDEVVAKAKLADELRALPTLTSMDDRSDYLAALAATEHGAHLGPAVDWSGYTPPRAEFPDDDSVRTVGGTDEDRDAVPDDDEDGYPHGKRRALPAVPEQRPAFVIQGEPTEEALLFGAGPDLTEDSIAWRFDTGLFRIVPAGVSA